jgi:hypothetical protein
MSDREQIPCYIARHRTGCQCIFAAMIDDPADADNPEHQRDIQGFLIEQVKAGGQIERVNVGYVREHFGCKKLANCQEPENSQLSMFSEELVEP